MVPDGLAQFLIDFRDQIFLGFLGLSGSTVDVLLYQASGKQMPKAMIYATLISGPILALTASTLMGSYMGLDITKSGVLGLCAYLTGMTARRISALIFDMDVSLPWGKRK